jgi:uncharacterized protein YbbC (DUF1343 family)
MAKVGLGIERLNSDERGLVHGRRIGLVAHPASTTSSFVHALDLLLGAGARVEVLFGPEHGFGGQAQDMEAVDGAVSGPGGRPLISLYGRDEASLTPDRSRLEGLDALVVDLFDIGSRYYTFVWTAVLCLRACHRAGVEMILTDRPNPLGGVAVEGAPQGDDYLSFVGLCPVANRHGLTVGEIVLMVAEREGLTDGLRVVPMQGWNRAMGFSETGLPWVMPSPNMPTRDTALVYPGLCLIEGTWASEGRGTTRPFELIGAPGLEGSRLAEALDGMDLPGVGFRPVVFKPGFQKHRGEDCGGVQLHVIDPIRFQPYRTGVALLLALKKVAGERFVWREKPYEFVTDRPAVDLLTGDDTVRQAVEAGATLAEVAETWAAGERTFRKQRERFFLYR